MFQNSLQHRTQPLEGSNDDPRSSKGRFPPWRRWLPLAALLAWLPPGGAALADEGSVAIESVSAPDIEVLSNGSSYTEVSGYALSHIVAHLRVKLDAGTVGRVKSFSAWVKARRKAPTTDYPIDFKDFAYSQSYPAFHRPKKVDEVVPVQVPLTVYRDWAVERCNVEAQYLRNSGHSDAEIFGTDRVIGVTVLPALKYEMTGWDNIWDPLDEGNQTPTSHFNIICKKWLPPLEPLAADAFEAELPLVESASLTIIEQYGPTGFCKLLLSGVVQSHEPNKKVNFRLEDGNGNRTGVLTVTTDHSKFAFFDYQEKIANNPDGPETGKVRIAIEGQDLQSDWKPYSMECVEPGPSDLVALLPPSVELSVEVGNVPGDKIMVSGQVCPRRIRLAGRIEGRGPYHGNAMFIGPSLVSPPEPYSVDHGSVEWVFHNHFLDWAQGPAAEEHAAPSNDLLEQTIKVGFNINGDLITESEPPAGQAFALAPGVPLGDPVIASVPLKTFTFTCSLPNAASGIQAGGALRTMAPTSPEAPQVGGGFVGAPQPRTVPQPRTLPQRSQEGRTAAAAGRGEEGLTREAPHFSILAPRGVLRQIVGVIRLQGVADRNGESILRWSARSNRSQAYRAVRKQGLPQTMKGANAKFAMKALTPGWQWRLEVCRARPQRREICRQTEFSLPEKPKSPRTTVVPKKEPKSNQRRGQRLQLKVKPLLAD